MAIGAGTSGNLVLGNRIGTDVFGTAKLGNSGNGAALPANDGSASVALAADASQFNKLKTLGWLVASVDDASGPAQVDEVPVKNLR